MYMDKIYYNLNHIINMKKMKFILNNDTLMIELDSKNAFKMH